MINKPIDSLNIRDAVDCDDNYPTNKSFAGLFYVISRIYTIPDNKLCTKSKLVLIETVYALTNMSMLQYVEKPKDVDFFNLI